MKKVFSFLLVMFLFACGGGSNSPTSNLGEAPSGNFSGQVDPVQTK